MPKHLLNKCRICLSDGEIEIFSKYSSEKIPSHIKLFTNIKISKYDHLPKMLCTACYDLLQSAIIFRHLALETNDKLNKMKETKRKQRKSRKKKTSYEYIECEVEFGNQSDMEDATEFISTTRENEIKQEESDEDDWPLITLPQKREPDKYECKKCELEFTNSEEFLAHMRTEEHKKRKNKQVIKRTSCNICHTTMVEAYLETHMIRKHSTEKPFVCEICGKGFPAQGPLQRHAKTHTDELPYKCSECPYRGRFSDSLKLHMRVHTGDKPYACHMCSAQFTFPSNFKKHIMSHKTEYDYKCEQCGKGFHTKAQLEKHVRIDHNGVKDFKCAICGKEFGYKTRLTRHKRLVHKMKSAHRGRCPLYVQLQQRETRHDATQEIGAQDEEHAQGPVSAVRTAATERETRHDATQEIGAQNEEHAQGPVSAVRTAATERERDDMTRHKRLARKMKSAHRIRRQFSCYSSV